MRGFCPESDWFAAFGERKLKESDEVWLRRHASRCDDCRQHLALVTMQVGREAPDSVPADVQARVRAGILRTVERHRNTRRFRVKKEDQTRYLIFAAAAALIIFSLVFVIEFYQPNNQDTRPIVQDEPVIKNQPDKEIVKDDAPEKKVDPREWPPVDEKGHEFVKKPDDIEKEFVKPKRDPEKDIVEKPDKDKPEFDPDRPRRPTKVWGKVVKVHGKLVITDPVGQLALRRYGQKDTEQVTGPIEVGDGDVLVAKGPSAFYLGGTHGVVLEEDTELSVSSVDDGKASWFTVYKGEAIIRSRGQEWWFANGARTMGVDKTDSLFAVSSKDRKMRVTPLSRRLGCQNEEGDKFGIDTGHAAVLDGSGRKSEAVSRRDRRSHWRRYDSTRPKERTLLFSVFDYKKREGDPLIVREGIYTRRRAGSGYDNFLKGAPRKNSSRIKLEFRDKEIIMESRVTIRFRYRTNASNVLLSAPIKGKPCELQYSLETDANHLNKWVTAEISARDFQLEWSGQGKVLLNRDIYKALHFTANRSDVRGGEAPYILIDDVQIVD